ncbi:MAG: APA family fibronectin-binding glycoprotein [Mycobacterium sp.]
MDDPTPRIRARGIWTSLAVAAVSGLTAAGMAFPATIANADPVAPSPAPAPAPADPNAPVPAPAPAPAPADPNAPAPAPAPADPNAPAPAPAPADPNAPAPAPADPNAPAPAPADPNAPAPAPAPELGRVDNAVGGFSYVLPPGWVVGDASKLNYGQALLSKETGPAVAGQPAPVATDTSILLGRLDLKLFAGAEPDNAKAAVRLASDMGEFFMPYPGTRVNQQTFPLNANGLTGSASSYEVKFTDTTKPNGQIWAGVVGNAGVNAPRGQRNERWFVVWLGTSKSPIDTNAAVALANSIRPFTPPPAPEAPAPGPVDPNAPAPAPAEPGHAPVGVPVPVAPENAPGMMPQ